MARISLPLVMCALLAGCASAPATVGPEDVPTGVPLDIQSCAIARAALVVPKVDLAAQLPEGFVPRSASAYLGPAGGSDDDGLVVVGVARCELAAALDGEATFTMAELSIFIESPDVPGEREPADEDFFMPTLLTPSPLLPRLVANASWSVESVDAGVAIDTTPPTARASAGWVEEGGGEVRFEVSGAADAPHAGLERYWTPVDGGYGFLEATTDVAQKAGAVTCAFDPGTRAVEMSGVALCIPGRAFGLAVVSGTWAYRVVPRA